VVSEVIELIDSDDDEDGDEVRGLRVGAGGREEMAESMGGGSKSSGFS